MSKTLLKISCVIVLIVFVIFCGKKFFQEPVKEATVSQPEVSRTPVLAIQSKEPLLDRIAEQIKSLFEAEKYSECLAQAELYLQNNPNSAAAKWVREQLPVIFTALGWQQIHAGRCDLAQQYFAKAEAKPESKIAQATLGKAYCFQKSEDLIEASKQYRIYLKENSNDANAWRALAKVYESLGQFTEANDALESAIGTQPENERRSLLKEQKLLKQRETSSATRQYLSSANFRLYYDENQHLELANPIFNYLEESLQQFTSLLSFPGPEQPFEVYLYPQAEFKSIYADVPHWVGGLFDGKIRVPLLDPRNARDFARLHQILAHELLHALLHNNTTDHLPTWFDEGIAQRFSCVGSSCSDFSFGPTPGAFLSSDELSGSFLQFDEAKAVKAYRQSLFLILVLERNFQITGISEMISNLKNLNNVDSNTILSPLNISFAKLWQTAKSKWDKRQL